MILDHIFNDLTHLCPQPSPPRRPPPPPPPPPAPSGYGQSEVVELPPPHPAPLVVGQNYENFPNVVNADERYAAVPSR